MERGKSFVKWDEYISLLECPVTLKTDKRAIWLSEPKAPLGS